MSNIRQIGEDKDCVFDPYRAAGNVQKAYQLRPNSIYKLDLRVYDLRHTPDSAQEIIVRSSSDLLAVSQPFATTVGGPSDHSVLIACKRTIENTLATLEVDLKQQIDLPDAETKDGKKTRSANVIAAKPTYMLSISVSRALLVWFIVFVFLGVSSPVLLKNFSLIFTLRRQRSGRWWLNLLELRALRLQHTLDSANYLLVARKNTSGLIPQCLPIFSV